MPLVNSYYSEKNEIVRLKFRRSGKRRKNKASRLDFIKNPLRDAPKTALLFLLNYG
jgi:hypothetical protein